jgi:hypothetical protein
MDWQRHPSDDAHDPTGLAALLRQAQDEAGSDPVQGTRFLHDAGQMLQLSREIEASVSGVGATLWVGFQNVATFLKEFDVYRDLTRQGSTVHAFGEGAPQAAAELARFSWTGLPRRPHALENQWFLVTREPEPVAFVGFEISPEAVRGQGDATGPAKSWEGFVSSDDRLADLIIAHLEIVVRDHHDS